MVSRGLPAIRGTSDAPPELFILEMSVPNVFAWKTGRRTAHRASDVHGFSP